MDSNFQLTKFHVDNGVEKTKLDTSYGGYPCATKWAELFQVQKCIFRYAPSKRDIAAVIK
jgi:hypothetical protein